MPRVKENLEIVTLRLSAGTRDKLTNFYRDLGYNRVIRLLVDKHLEQLEQAVARKTAASAAPLEVQLSDLDLAKGTENAE